jgi:hypothetical protein
MGEDLCVCVVGREMKRVDEKFYIWDAGMQFGTRSIKEQRIGKRLGSMDTQGRHVGALISINSPIA